MFKELQGLFNNGCLVLHSTEFSVDSGFLWQHIKAKYQFFGASILKSSSNA